MNDKFTFRDFLVYFLTGIALIIGLLIVNYEIIYRTLNPDSQEFEAQKNLLSFFKDNNTFLAIASIPLIYFIGQIIHSVDTIVYFFGRLLWRASGKFDNHGIAGAFGKNVLSVLIALINGYRITGTLNRMKIDVETFWRKTAKLQIANQYASSEYWYVMNDLFKGLTLISFCLFLFYSAWWKLLLILTFLFALRARYFAENFIRSVEKSEEALFHNK
ncbi:MAG: hypothetical protein ACKVTZ_05440 [Bacteroidia bacterium]